MVGDRSIPGSLFRTECDAMFCCSYENLTKPESVDPCRLQKFIVYRGFVILCRVQNPRRVFPFTARNRAISFVQRTFASDAIGCHDRGLRERHAEKKKFPTVLDAITIWLVVLPILKNLEKSWSSSMGRMTSHM